MSVSRILHQCTRGLYRDFFNQSSSQRILKVALPLMGILLLGGSIALARFFRRQFTTTPTEAAPTSTETTTGTPKAPVLKVFPKKLYNGVLLPHHPDLYLQAHRWCNKTNLDTLVILSHGKAYPANCLMAARSSYIMAESPLNNGIVNWKEDYYRMAIEKEAELLISVASPFKDGKTDQLVTEEYHFAIDGKPLKIDNFTVECVGKEKISDDVYYAYELKISKDSQPYKTIWQLLPIEAPGSSFKEIQAVVNMVNTFVKDKKLTLDNKHPLLVNCRSGIDRTGRFVLFHHLQQTLEAKILVQIQDPNITDEAITDGILGDANISEMLIKKARNIESLSTETAAVDAIRDHVLPNFSGKPNCTPETVKSTYKEHVLETIKKMRAIPH